MREKQLNAPPRIYPAETIRKPMIQVVQRLQLMGVNLARMRALEFFAREGDWQTLGYANQVNSLDAWEINPDFEPALRKSLPRAKICIGDSYQLALQPKFKQQFDFLVLDNPQVVFGQQGEHCEHFEAILLAPHLLSPSGGILVFNVNHNPYGYEKFPEWQKRRNEFYGLTKTAKVELSFLETFYRQLFKRLGFTTSFLFFEQRHEPSIAYCVAGLQRI